MAHDPLPSPKHDLSSVLRHRTTSVVAGLALLLVLTITMQSSSLGQTVARQVEQATTSLTTLLRLTPDPEAGPAPNRMPAHPSRALAPYLNPDATTATTNAPVLNHFHDLLRQFEQRQGEDDNFTVRVIDRRSEETLEVYDLPDLRAQYEQEGTIAWRQVDQERREATERLVDKYVERGVPKEDIIVRWGRANQVQQAHERDRPYATYEVQLAQALGLSLLPSEIGTVETFNQDDLVSSAGARSRYQMLPWILRYSGVNRYHLPTTSGTYIDIKEELHPLLVLEPAFLLLRGYVNAVGHEIPGLSAYHAGPGTIYNLYELYYEHSGRFSGSSTVADAYLWAATEGFETAREKTPFGPFSRGYIPSLYGALKAHDDVPIQPTQTFRAARVQLQPGASLTLDAILSALSADSLALDWGATATSGSLYERFRKLNVHMDLPASPDGTRPPDANLRFRSDVEGQAVRIFLPLGGPEALRAAGHDVLNPAATVRYTDSTYTAPSPQQRTKWDRQYAALVDETRQFGFTRENRQKLLSLHDRFVELAEQNPSTYRHWQLNIIRTHRRLWRSSVWEDLADKTAAAHDALPVPVYAPEAGPVPLDSMTLPTPSMPRLSTP
jgi:hypothetical protein